ncbi:hypothetical protein HXX76_008061 [Chlamydomonas incerta]|uniref:Uncharacterized protein n=1 Tax=Chlamydomonas incerta TaxID=51695 RepID=A0A835W2K3_CHLIN|nr:hypothetical protein HXX76_008061 [Chlamydomonas incerta]|eukprot:KAG2433691.1 hypothetical protein HXX76_008061 [Chlamydomonas incerta]
MSQQVASALVSLRNCYASRRDPADQDVALLGALEKVLPFLSEQAIVNIATTAVLPLMQLLAWTSASLTAAYVAAMAGDAGASGSGSGASAGLAAQRHAARAQRLFRCHELVMTLTCRLLSSGDSGAARLACCVLRMQVLRMHSRVACRACSARPRDPQPLLELVAAPAAAASAWQKTFRPPAAAGPTVVRAPPWATRGVGGHDGTGLDEYAAALPLLRELADSGLLEHAARLLLLHSAAAGGGEQRRRWRDRAGRSHPVLRCLGASLVAARCWSRYVISRCSGADAVRTHIVAGRSAAAAGAAGTHAPLPSRPWGTCLRTLALSQAVVTLAAAGFGGGVRGVWGLPEGVAAALPVLGCEGGLDPPFNVRPHLEELRAQQRRPATSQQGSSGGRSCTPPPPLLWISWAPYALLTELLEADLMQLGCWRRDEGAAGGVSGDGDGGSTGSGSSGLGAIERLDWPLSRRSLAHVCLRIVDLAAAPATPAAAAAAGGDGACEPIQPAASGERLLAAAAAAAGAAAAVQPVPPPAYQLRLPAVVKVVRLCPQQCTAASLAAPGDTRHSVAIDLLCEHLELALSAAVGRDTPLLPRTAPAGLAAALQAGLLPALEAVLRRIADTATAARVALSVVTAPAEHGGSGSSGGSGGSGGDGVGGASGSAAPGTDGAAAAVPPPARMSWSVLQLLLEFAPPAQMAALITSLGKRLVAAFGELNEALEGLGQNMAEDEEEEEGGQAHKNPQGRRLGRCINAVGYLASALTDLLPPSSGAAPGCVQQLSALSAQGPAAAMGGGGDGSGSHDGLEGCGWLASVLGLQEPARDSPSSPSPANTPSTEQRQLCLRARRLRLLWSHAQARKAADLD